MFILTPVVLLILTVVGGGVVAAKNNSAESIEAQTEIAQADVTNVAQAEEYEGLITVNGFPVHTFTSCSGAHLKAKQLQSQSPDLLIRANCANPIKETRRMIQER